MEVESGIAVFTYAQDEFFSLAKVLRSAFEIRTLNNPEADEDELADLIASAVEAFEEGQMLVIDEEVE